VAAPFPLSTLVAARVVLALDVFDLIAREWPLELIL
jgi:hypothetical protein